MVALESGNSLLIFTSGVLPMSSVTSPAIFVMMFSFRGVLVGQLCRVEKW